MNSMMKLWRLVTSFVLAVLCTAAGAGTVTYYHNDLAGTPVVATNASGQVIWRESYRPYGERLTNAPASSGNAIWFTSRRQDAETGLVYMGARYYDPVIGRFMSTDPVGFDEKNVHSHNRYAYANSNPYRFKDPDGAQAVPAIMPPSQAPTTVPMGPLVRPSEQGQIRNLEGYATYNGGFSIPSMTASDVINFMIGGFPAVISDKLNGLIFSEGNNSLGANPFKGKSAQEIADMLSARGFDRRGPDPESGRGTFVNPETGRGYHIDAHHGEPKGPHVGVHRPKDKRDVLPPRDYPMGGSQ